MNGRQAARAASAADAAEPGAFDPGFRGDWIWIQPKRFHRRWELRCGEATVANLTLPGVLRGAGVATFADGTLRFRMHLLGGLDVTKDGAAGPWGRYRPGWLSGGRLRLAEGGELLWRRQDFWMRRWAIVTPEHLPLVRISLVPEFLRMSGRVELEDAARRRSDLPALLALGWILVVLAHRGHSHYH